MIPLAIFMIGRTAAGKTTLSEDLCKQLAIPYVSEAAKKRELKPAYTTEDSLDESLRDRAYHLAIKECCAHVSAGTPSLVDASFHKRYRRDWLYSAAQAAHARAVVGIYCRCPSRAVTTSRITARRTAKKTAKTHADSMTIYDFIDANFDEPSIAELPPLISSALFCVDSQNNQLTVESISRDGDFDLSLLELQTWLIAYLSRCADEPLSLGGSEKA